MSSKSLPALDIIRFFETKASLVVAAVASLDSLSTELAKLGTALITYDRSAVTARLAAIDSLLKRAAVGPDNLLVANAAVAPEPFVLCAVSRQPTGTVEVKTIELDRDALAIAGVPRDGRPRPLNALIAAVQALATDRRPEATKVAAAAIEALSAQVRSTASRLSLVKARLDLQQSFLASLTDVGAPTPSSIRADSHLNLSGARDMAMEARRLLSARSLNIGKSAAPEAPEPARLPLRPASVR